MATCATALVKLLENYGVNLVFGIPGAHTLELYRGLANSTIRHITPRHEQGAGFMADGYARVTGKPGVCFVITGPGITNIATAMAQAYADSIPMLVISSVNARHQMNKGNGHLHELPSQRNLTVGFTAFSHTLITPDELPEILARAFAVFKSARPRPIHIEIPLDVMTASANHLSLMSVPAPSKPMAGSSTIAQVAATLLQARRPLILAGGGSIEAATELQILAEYLQAPVALTINAKGILAPDHPLSIGSTQSTAVTRELVKEADVVLAIGTELGETDYDIFYDGKFAISGELIRIDIDTQQLSRNYLASLAIVADAKLALTALLAALTNRQRHKELHNWGSKRVAKIRNTVAENYDASTRAQKTMLDAVLQALPDVIIVGDSTQPVYVGNLTYEATAPRSWFNSSTGFGTLGYALPAAIGAKLAAGKRTVVCLIGDGGLQFTLPELASAVEAQLPVIVLLWNNNGYGEIKKYMKERNIPPLGVDIYTPDFMMLAHGFGCIGKRIETVKDLIEQLRCAAKRNIPTLLEINEKIWIDAEGI